MGEPVCRIWRFSGTSLRCLGGGGPPRPPGGFHPLLCYLDGTGEALAGILRPGNAGSNTAADHIVILDEALFQLPVWEGDRPREGTEIVVRADSAGLTPGFGNGIGH